MRIAFAVGALVTSSAFGAYTLQSRFSEAWRINDNGGPSTNLGSSTSLVNPFVSAEGCQTSFITATGATYTGRPTAESGIHRTSSFELVFALSTPTAYSITGSLKRFFAGNSVLTLNALTPGGSPSRSASAAGDFNDNFPPTIVNWSGVLAPGTYKLAIAENAQTWIGGWAQYTESQFTFAIPTPGATTCFAILLVPTLRRRRA